MPYGHETVLLTGHSIDMNALTGNAQNHAARSIIQHYRIKIRRGQKNTQKCNGK
jgi:hypothetical protein